MFKKLVVLLGLLAMSEGMWLIANERFQNNACNASLQGLRSPGLATSSQCFNIAFVYFGGFALSVAGALLVGFGLVLVRRQLREKRTQRSGAPRLFNQWMEAKKSAGEVPRIDAGEG